MLEINIHKHNTDTTQAQTRTHREAEINTDIHKDRYID